MNTLLFSSLMLASISACFTRMVHPLAMGLTLILQTIAVCASAGLLSKFMWFSYILFLIFLGAALVLFIYVTSLASNETFKLSVKMMWVFTIPLTALLFLPITDQMLTPTKDAPELSFLSSLQDIQTTQMSISNMYSTSTSTLTGVIILYLLLTLIVVVKLSSNFYGPLRTS